MLWSLKGFSGLFLFSLLLAVLMLASSQARAGEVRLYALGDLDWIIDDDANDFANPASSAWAESAYFSVDSGIDAAFRRMVGGPLSEVSAGLSGNVYYVAPIDVAGVQSVFGGRVTGAKAGEVGRSNEVTALGICLQDAVRIGDRLSVGGSVGYYPQIQVSRFYLEYPYHMQETSRESVELEVGGAAAYHFADRASLDLRVFSSSVSITQNTFHDGELFDSYSHAYRTANGQVRVIYAFSEQLGASAVLQKTIRFPGYRDPDSENRVLVGVAYKPDSRLLLIGGLERGQWRGWEERVEYAGLRGGAEYEVNDRLILRGSTLMTSVQGDVVNPGAWLEVRAGMGLRLGKGLLDVSALLYSDHWSAYRGFGTLQAGYTLGF